MNEYRLDLHIHTVLSPCACDEMTPRAIVDQALRAGLDMIAICDHNSAGNARATQQAAAGARLAVVAGMEIETAEEVHVLGLFGSADLAESAGGEVLATLPKCRQGKRSGRQSLCDAQGRQRARETRMLSAATTLSLERAVGLIHQWNGLAVASHVDRPSYSVYSQLGFFPADAGFDAIEVHGYLCAGKSQPWLGLGLPVLHSSDSHYLADIGSRETRLRMAGPTFEDLCLTLRHT